MRAAFEAVHLSLPTMLFITFGVWAIESFGQSLLDEDYLTLAGLFVLDSVLISVAMTLVVVFLKWVTMGRYEPVVKPMWSFWAMRTEACAVLYWGLAGRVLLEHLRGTPFLPWMLRLFGSKFGKGVFMDTTDITEFDCVKVGDFAAVNAVSALQTHLYEDRVMKVGRVDVGNGVTVGAGSTVLYDTHVGDFAQLGPLTIVMKGESIPPHSKWIGAPAQPAPSHARVTARSSREVEDQPSTPPGSKARISSIILKLAVVGLVGFVAGAFLAPLEPGVRFRAAIHEGLKSIPWARPF